MHFTNKSTGFGWLRRAMNDPASNPPAKQTLAALPVSLFGAVMGVAGLGLLWRDVAEVFGGPFLIGEALIFLGAGIFALVGAAYILKFLRHRDQVAAEYRNSAQVGFFSTIPIAGLLLSAGLFPYSVALADILWWLSTALMFVLSLLLVSRLLTESHPVDNANGSWLIGMVSPIIVPIAGLQLCHHAISHFMLSIGIFMWLVVFTIIMNRTIFGGEVAHGLRPTWFIFLVPPSIIFISYMDMKGGELDFFARSLYSLTIFLTAVLCFVARDFLKWPFSVAWWAFTFPLVAMASATVVYYRYEPGPASLAIAIAGNSPDQPDRRPGLRADHQGADFGGPVFAAGKLTVRDQPGRRVDAAVLSAVMGYRIPALARGSTTSSSTDR
jgi:tellurite resistance protein